MQISTDVLNVLAASTVNGKALDLPAGQLDRKLYEQVAKTIKAAGGAWNKKARTHLFPFDAADVVDAMLLTGEVTRPQDFGYFPTPPPVVGCILDLADLESGMRVLEPSAGRGAIAGPVAARGHDVDCIELLDENAAAIKKAGFAASVTVGDFLELTPDPAYPRVLMNPPFARQADIHHVLHAHRFLAPGGLLVSVMSNAVTFRTNKLTADFRSLVEDRGGEILPLPASSFTVSGTEVHTVLLRLPAAEA